MGSGSHGYPSTRPDPWVPARGPCEWGEKSPPPAFQRLLGGTRAHSRERRRSKDGKRERELVTQVEKFTWITFTFLCETDRMTTCFGQLGIISVACQQYLSKRVDGVHEILCIVFNFYNINFKNKLQI